MTAADITEYVNCPIPNIEIVLLECTDGETYTSRKFKIPRLAIPFWQVDTDGDINAVVNQTTGLITVNAVGASNSAIGLLVIGGKHS
jgi:hypothetical protein